MPGAERPGALDEFWMPNAMPSTVVMFQTDGPSSDMIDIRSSNGGNAIHASSQ